MSQPQSPKTNTESPALAGSTTRRTDPGQASSKLRSVALILALALFLVLAVYQLGLPGLHYDEAKEAGVNAMQLLTGAPVTAFRDAVVEVGSVRLPLMVQDYIGALNVYLALPFLGLTGIGVPNLRFLPVVIGLVTLLLLFFTVAEWEKVNAKCTMHNPQGRGPSPAPDPQPPIPTPGSPIFAVLLLAASPSFVFWSRQGIFVTNLTLALSLFCVWMGLRWLRTGQTSALILSGLAAGLALYAKLLAVWIVGPFGLMAAGWWLWQRFAPGRQTVPDLPRPSAKGWIGAGVAFFLGLTPLLIFNLQTGGTFASIGGNLGNSYYGVNNADVLGNLPVRLGQLVDMLQGDHLWYLGGVYANRLAPWLAGIGTMIGLVRRPRAVLPPLLLLTLAVGASLFTVSDLFITHYALIQPFAVAVVAIGIGDRVPDPRSMIPVLLIGLWLFFDLSASVHYHRALTRSGGLGDHSDATYHLAYYLRYNGLGAPIVLDWGMEAPVRYLTEGSVDPIEIFGYDSLDTPDPEFSRRLDPFLPNPANVYLLRAEGSTVFQGRRQIFLTQAAAQGLTPRLEATFAQRDGTVLFELWRAQ